MKKLILSLFIFTISFAVSDLAAGATEVLKAGDLVNRAISRSSELRVINHQIEADRAKVSQAAAWDDPILDLGTETRTSPQGETGLGKVGIAQFVPRPGRLAAREKAARGGLELSVSDREFAEAELRARVLKLIYSYRVSSEKATHAKERFERFQTIVSFLRSRPFASPQKRAEASIVRSKLLVLQRDLRELEAGRRIAWIELNHYLEFEREPRLEIPWYTTAPKFAARELERKAEAANPEIRRQALALRIKESAVLLARYDGWPGFNLSASFSRGAGANPETAYGVGVSFPLPVMNGNRSTILASEAARLAEDERLKWTRDRTGEKILSALERYNAVAASLNDLSPEKLSPLEREMAEIDMGFKKGQVDLITYLEADSQHVASLNAVLDAQVDLLSALAELTLLTGEAPQPLEN